MIIFMNKSIKSEPKLHVNVSTPLSLNGTRFGKMTSLNIYIRLRFNVKDFNDPKSDNLLVIII